MAFGPEGAAGFGGASPPPDPLPRRRPWLWLVVGLVVIALVAAGGVYVVRGLVDEDGDSDSGDVSETVSAPVEPLSFLPVTEVVPGPCGSGDPDRFYSASTDSCLAVSRAAPGFRVQRLEAVTAAHSEVSMGWIIRLAFVPADQSRFSELSRQAVGAAPPQNQVAIVLGDRLLTAPAMQTQIDPGQPVEIGGAFTRAEAERLARDMGGSG